MGMILEWTNYRLCFLFNSYWSRQFPLFPLHNQRKKEEGSLSCPEFGLRKTHRDEWVTAISKSNTGKNYLKNLNKNLTKE